MSPSGGVATFRPASSQSWPYKGPHQHLSGFEGSGIILGSRGRKMKDWNTSLWVYLLIYKPDVCACMRACVCVCVCVCVEMLPPCDRFLEQLKNYWVALSTPVLLPGESPWTEPGRLRSMGSHVVRQDWETFTLSLSGACRSQWWLRGCQWQLPSINVLK